MALPPSRATPPAICRNQLLPPRSPDPTPPRLPFPQEPQAPVPVRPPHRTQLPGARANPACPGALARLLRFPLFFFFFRSSPPSPIRIVCLNSTLTNMDSFRAWLRAVMKLPAPGAGYPLAAPTELNAAPPWRRGDQGALEGAVLFPVHSSLPPHPRPRGPGPGTRSLPRKGPAGGQ